MRYFLHQYMLEGGGAQDEEGMLWKDLQQHFKRISFPLFFFFKHGCFDLCVCLCVRDTGIHTAVPWFISRCLAVFTTASCSPLFWFSGVFSPLLSFFSSPPLIIKEDQVIHSITFCSFTGDTGLCTSLCSYFFLNSFLKELLKPPLSCFRLLSAKGVWWFSSVPVLHFDSSPHDWKPESWCDGTLSVRPTISMLVIQLLLCLQLLLLLTEKCRIC